MQGDLLANKSSQEVTREKLTPQETSVQGITGLSSTNVTTMFVDDANVVKKDDSMVTHVTDFLPKMNDTRMLQQSIIDFLEKPILLTNGNFNITDTLSIISKHSLPFAAFNTVQGALWKAKLAGYFGIRMDMRLRVVVNANKFQQGRYILAWVPLASAQNSLAQAKNLLTNDLHLASLVQRTTVPHVEFDLNSSTSAELLIPFVSPHNFYPLNTLLAGGSDVATLGYANLYAYSPLVSPAGSSTAGYNIYINFENIHLVGAASAQMGVSDNEVTNKMDGPISSVANSISRGFKEFSNIPLLSSYALPISWISDRIATTASIFGFSKPTQGDSMSKVTILNASNHTTVDGDSDARVLSLISKPAVSKVDGLSGTKFDEMDFSYVSRKFAWFKSIDWSLNDNIGLLTSINVTPATGVISLGGAYHHTPVAFISRLFHYWRGSIKIKIKIVKTDFHSGRLAFCFYPTDELSFVSNPAYVHRDIIDIRNTKEMEFTIPYISRRPWSMLGEKIGVFNVEVVDKLVAPASVHSSVQLLFEIAGGDDIEFSVPSRLDLSIKPIVPQSGLNNEQIFKSTIGGSQVNSNPLMMTSACIGEKITSLRAYLKRYTPLRLSDTGEGVTIDFNGRELLMRPDAILSSSIGAATTIVYSDPYSIISSCYAIISGGMRIRDIIDLGLTDGANNKVNTSVLTYMEPETGSLNSLTPFTSVNLLSNNSDTVPCFYQNILQNNMISLEVPQYTTTIGRSKADIIVYQGSPDVLYGYNAGVTSSNSHMYVSVVLPQALATSISSVDGFSVHNPFRSVSDDFNLSCFISVPPFEGNTQAMNKGLY